MSRPSAHIEAARRQREGRRSSLPSPREVAITTLAMSAALYTLGQREISSESTWAAAVLVADTAYSEGWSWERIVADPEGACAVVEALWATLGGAS